MTQHSRWRKELHVVEVWIWTPTVCYNRENGAGWWVIRGRAAVLFQSVLAGVTHPSLGSQMRAKD